MSPHQVPVSVVVPCYNASATIRDCLNALTIQTFNQEYELILVDSSEDETPEIVRAEFPQVRLVHLPQRTLPGQARNIGIGYAKGYILAFTDADCIVASDWLASMVETHQADPALAGVAGSIEMAPSDSDIALCSYIMEFSGFLPGDPGRRVAQAPTCNLSFKHWVFERFGKFPDDLWPGEDLVFTWRLTRQGEQISFIPEIRVQHINRSDWDSLKSHQHRLGFASARARLRQRDLPTVWLTNAPMLVQPVAFLRVLRILGRLGRTDRRLCRRSMLLLPILFRASSYWGRGFRTALAG